MEAYVLTKDDVEFLKGALTTLRNTSVNPMQLPTDTQSYDQATSTYLVLTPPGGIGRATPGTASNSLAMPTYASCQVVQQNNVIQPPQLFIVPGFTVPVWNYDLQASITGNRVIPVVQNTFGEWVPCITPPGTGSGAYIALTPPEGIPAGFYPDGMGTGTGTGSGTGTGTGCQGHAEHFTTGQASCSVFRIIDAAVGNLRPVGISEVVYNLAIKAIPGCSVILIVQDAYGYWVAVDPNQSSVFVERIYTANDTWTKPSGLVAVEVEVIGGGGGGGSIPGRSATLQGAAGGGGGGGYSYRKVVAELLGSTESITVGAGGIGGDGVLHAAGNGQSGGTSSFGSWLSATGGDGGLLFDGVNIDALNVSSGGKGGIGSSGDLNVAGCPGGYGSAFTNTTATHIGSAAGNGGDSPYGGGGLGPVFDGGASNTIGATGRAYGGGGSGSIGTISGTTSVPGPDGAAGVVIIREFYGYCTAATTSLDVTPPGSLMPFAGSSAPTGWLLCDGASYLRATYTSLFAAIGTTWGSADGTHFNVPDLRGRDLIGSGTGSGLTARTLGAIGGEEAHTLTVPEMPSHSHTVVDPTHHHGFPAGVNIFTDAPFGPGSTPSLATPMTLEPATDDAATGISLSPNGGDEAHNNMQPFAVVTWLIKT